MNYKHPLPIIRHKPRKPISGPTPLWHLVAASVLAFILTIALVLINS